MDGPRAHPGREMDRRITVGGMVVAMTFVGAAIVVSVGGVVIISPIWLPIHLALTGGATTAIAAVLPFFTSALTVSPPADPRLRVAAVAAVSLGTSAIVGSMALGDPFLGHLAGTLYLAGVGLIAIAAFQPIRGALGPRRRRVERAYAAALVMVALGAAMAIGYLSGWSLIVDRWAVLKPAHAWLNLFGFLSLVIVATLVHLGPTIEATRIRPRRSASLAIAGIAIGVPAVALGFATGASVVGRIGALAVIVAGIAVVAHAVVLGRERGRWTTDAGWHRMSAGSLRAAAAWFAISCGLAAGPIVVDGPVPAAWSIERLAVPFAVGWVLQTLVGSWSHLIPALGGGSPAAGARRRRILGWAAWPRLVALQAGVAGLWFARSLDVAPIGWASTALLGGTVGLAIALAMTSVIGGRLAPSMRPAFGGMD